MGEVPSKTGALILKGVLHRNMRVMGSMNESATVTLRASKF
jgi:hypothetical protein